MAFQKVAQREQVSLLKDLKGSLEGTFKGHSTQTIKGKETLCYKFDLVGGRMVIFPANAGLKNIMDNSNVQEGMLVKIENTGKKELTGGKTVNTYDLYIDA